MVRTDSPAVEVAREHVRARSNHELGKARAVDTQVADGSVAFLTYERVRSA